MVRSQRHYLRKSGNHNWRALQAYSPCSYMLDLYIPLGSCKIKPGNRHWRGSLQHMLKLSVLPSGSSVIWVHTNSNIGYLRKFKQTIEQKLAEKGSRVYQVISSPSTLQYRQSGWSRSGVRRIFRCVINSYLDTG